MKLRWIVALIIVMLDQAFKYLAATYADQGGLITFYKNTGVTFGLLQGSNSLMILVSIIAGIAVAWYLWKARRTDAIGLTLLLGGITGNFIDRLLRAGVVDYISIGSFPVFNLADACIVTGVILLLLIEIPAVRKRFKD